MLLITLIIIIFSNLNSSNGLRVCSSFEDYILPFNNHCYNNPDPELNTTEILRRWGLTADEFYFTTEDGYIILLNRAYDKITKPNPVLFVHGSAMNGRGFVQFGNKSLPYILAKMGYLVYIINLRGTLYSRRHVNLTANEDKYWEFSYHEIAIYDVRNAIELITAETKEKVIYVGYSLGTTISYIYASLFPQEAKERVLGIISLGPVAYLQNIRSILKILPPIWPIIRSLLFLLLHGELPLGAGNTFCPSNPAFMFLCTTAVVPVVGDDYGQLWDPITTRINLKMGTDNLAAEIVTHYLQWVVSGKFQFYDYGETKNLEKYKQRTPPLYNLGDIVVPISLIVGANDWLATEDNAKRLYSELNTQCGYTRVPWEKWCHYDFVSAKNIDIILAPLVIDKITRFERGIC